MIHLLIFFVIGKYFIVLAERYNKPRWASAVMGVVSYFFGAIGGGAITGALLADRLSSNPPEDVITTVNGTLGACIVYYILRYLWKKEHDTTPVE